jgi:hypothetical protein
MKRGSAFAIVVGDAFLRLPGSLHIRPGLFWQDKFDNNCTSLKQILQKELDDLIEACEAFESKSHEKLVKILPWV